MAPLQLAPWLDEAPPPTPEQQLICAVLLRALEDVSRPDQEAFADAERWTDEEADRLFSFRWCCEQLGLDPRRLRLVFARARRQGLRAYTWLSA